MQEFSMKQPIALPPVFLALIMGAQAALFSPLAGAQNSGAATQDADPTGLRELASRLPAVAEVLGNAIQVAQSCGMSTTDMQGTQHAYFTILSTASIVASFRTISPEVKKLWPTEKDFKAAFQRGQVAVTSKGRPTDQICEQVKLKFPAIDEHEEQSSRVLQARLRALKTADDQEAEARILAGHAPSDAT
jgi:hypothetical protein